MFFVIGIADLKIGIDSQYDYLPQLCQDYIISDKNTDFDISLTDQDIEKEQTGDYPKAYLESLAVYRKIADEIGKYNGFLMHAAVIDVENCGVAFLARSGVGKTTHILNWKKLLGDNRMRIINGDKPLVRVVDGKVRAYGTPWSGKEKLGINSYTDIQKVCFVERADINECFALEKDKIFDRMIEQVYVDKEFNVFDMLNYVINKCEFYRIRCTADVESAKVAYEGIAI